MRRTAAETATEVTVVGMATAATVATATVAATARDADQVVADADAEEEEILGEGRLQHSRNERIQTHRHTNAPTTKQTARLLLARLSHRSIAARISRTACSLRSHCLCWLRSQSQQRARPGAQGLDVQ